MLFIKVVDNSHKRYQKIFIKTTKILVENFANKHAWAVDLYADL